jgi:hypothetical protein
MMLRIDGSEEGYRIFAFRKFGGTFRFRQHSEPDPESWILVAVYNEGIFKSVFIN